MTAAEGPESEPGELAEHELGEDKHSVLLTVAYDGRRFAGFAKQPGQRTIAGELLGAIQAIDPGVRDLRGASRTDAGVHAHGQRVAFDPTLDIPARGWVLGVTRHLPDEIAVRRAAFVPRGFSPRFTNNGKRYRYLVLRDPSRDPFLEGRVWRSPSFDAEGAIDRARREAARALGTHDFAAFRSSADERENTERTIRSITLSEDPSDPRLLRLDVEGSAFLHNMVRILVGTLADVARGRLPEGVISRALASRSRKDAGITAPPDGLYLAEVLLHEHEEADAWPPLSPNNPRLAVGTRGSALVK